MVLYKVFVGLNPIEWKERQAFRLFCGYRKESAKQEARCSFVGDRMRAARNDVTEYPYELLHISYN